MINLFFESVRFNSIKTCHKLRKGEVISSGQEKHFISTDKYIQFSRHIVLDLNLEYGKLDDIVSKKRFKLFVIKSITKKRRMRIL